jgi:uncharacterized protein YndB with AHSA1/START domain
MNQLSVAAEGEARAEPQVVWALVADADAYPGWGPWDAGGYEDPDDETTRGVGSIRWFRTGRTTTVEKVLEIDAGRRMVYTVVKGIPVRNYRAVVTLTPTDEGTRIHWAATWERTITGRIVQRALRKFYPKMLEQLIAAAEQGPSRPSAR